MIAYFDTAAFDQIYRKDGCSSTDVAALRKAVYGRVLTLRLSPHHLEEVLLSRKASPQALSAQLRHTLSFAGLRQLLKPCEHLLIGDVRNYATGGDADNPFLHGPIQDDYSSGIAELIESDGEEFTEEFREALMEVRRQKVSLTMLFERVRATLQADDDFHEHGELSLPKLWEAHAERVVGAIAEEAGVREQCRARGLEGLLGIRTVRAAAAMILTQISVPSSGVSIADNGAHHVIGAGAAGGIFVAGDERLRAALAPPANAHLLSEGWEVIDLAEVLGRVGAR